MVEPAMNEDRWGPKRVASASEYLKAKPVNPILVDTECTFEGWVDKPVDSTHMKRRDDVDQKMAREQRWKWLPRTRRGH